MKANPKTKTTKRSKEVYGLTNPKVLIAAFVALALVFSVSTFAKSHNKTQNKSRDTRTATSSSFGPPQNGSPAPNSGQTRDVVGQDQGKPNQYPIHVIAYKNMDARPAVSEDEVNGPGGQRYPDTGASIARLGGAKFSYKCTHKEDKKLTTKKGSATTITDVHNADYGSVFIKLKGQDKWKDHSFKCTISKVSAAGYKPNPTIEPDASFVVREGNYDMSGDNKGIAKRVRVEFTQ